MPEGHYRSRFVEGFQLSVLGIFLSVHFFFHFLHYTCSFHPVVQSLRFSSFLLCFSSSSYQLWNNVLFLFIHISSWRELEHNCLSMAIVFSGYSTIPFFIHFFSLKVPLIFTIWGKLNAKKNFTTVLHLILSTHLEKISVELSNILNPTDVK